MNNTTALTRSQEFDFSAIDTASLAESTKYKYKREIGKLLEAGVDPFDHQALTEYARDLGTSRKSFLSSALKILTSEYERKLKARATPENLLAVQAGVYRLEAMRGTLKTEQSKGRKAHTWLSQAQVKEITSLTGHDLEGRRDWIVLGLLLGAGLRRAELISLTFDALKQQPGRRGKMRDVLEVEGKGSKSRVIPIKPLLADRLRAWRAEIGEGFVARGFPDRSKSELSDSLSEIGVFKIVRKYGERIGVPSLAPHDLRRTFAQLGYEAGVPLTQISTLLGHANIATTQKYLNLDIDLETTASDFIPLSGD